MNRHARPDRCPKCHAAKFTVRVGFTRPKFTCDNFCYGWTSGRDGEPYFSNAKNVKPGQTWQDFVTHYWTGTYAGQGDFMPTGRKEDT